MDSSQILIKDLYKLWENNQRVKIRQSISYAGKKKNSPARKQVSDVVQMADCYKRPDLCNYYCSHKCAIGQRYVPEVEIGELSNIILETIACLNEINPVTGRLIQIARDGKISDDEIKDFAFLSQKLVEISLAVDSLNLWVDKTASENDLNVTLLREEKERLKKQK